MPADAHPPVADQQPAAQPVPVTQPPHPVRPLTPDQQLADGDVLAASGLAKQEKGIALTAAANQDEAQGELAALQENQAQQADLNKQRATFEADSAKTLVTKQLEADRAHADADNYKVDYNKFMNTMGVGDR